MPTKEREKLASSLKNAEGNMRWLVENYGRLRRKYRDSWVAIRNGKVIASDRDHSKLLRILERTGDNVGASTAVDFISATNPNFLL